MVVSPGQNHPHTRWVITTRMPLGRLSYNASTQLTGTAADSDWSLDTVVRSQRTRHPEGACRKAHHPGCPEFGGRDGVVRHQGGFYVTIHVTFTWVTRLSCHNGGVWPTMSPDLNPIEHVLALGAAPPRPSRTSFQHLCQEVFIERRQRPQLYSFTLQTSRRKKTTHDRNKATRSPPCYHVFFFLWGVYGWLCPIFVYLKFCPIL